MSNGEWRMADGAHSPFAIRHSAFFFGCLMLVCGCAGSGRISVVPANLQKISTTEPLVREWRVGRCYYWSEAPGEADAGDNDQRPRSRKTDRLCIAMEFESISLLGDYAKQQMWASFVLGGTPANVPRNYRVNSRSLRMIGRRGYGHTRWASLGGIVTVRREPNGDIRGRFRIGAKQQTFFIATGWSGNEKVLLLGEFRAVENPDAGRRILERTERDGMDRS